MRAWSKRVAQKGVYLEFPDIFLFAVKKSFELKVLVWKQGHECEAWDVDGCGGGRA